MTRPAKILFSLCLVLFFIPEAYSQSGQQFTVTGQIVAEVIPVFAASQSAQLNFGKFSPGSQGGEIIITPQNTVSVLGTVFHGGGMHNAASFYISGNEDAAFSITLPSGPVTLNHAGSSQKMIVQDWMSVPQQGTGTGLLQNGFQMVYVGATLKVGTLIDNPAGIYTGSYNITFDFN